MTTDSLINQARAALKTGEKQQAASLLMQVLRQENRNGEAWYLLEQAVEDPHKQQDCAKRWQALGYQPTPSVAPAIRPLNNVPVTEVLEQPAVPQPISAAPVSRTELATHQPKAAPTQPGYQAPPAPRVMPYSVASRPLQPEANDEHVKRRNMALLVIALGLLLIAVSIVVVVLKQRGALS